MRRHPVLFAVVVLAVGLGGYVMAMPGAPGHGHGERLAGSSASPVSDAAGPGLAAGSSESDATEAEVPSFRPFPRPGKKFFGVLTQTGPYDMERVEAVTQAAGRAPGLLMFSQGWAKDDFDEELFGRTVAAGMLPMVAWEPWDHTRPASRDDRADQPEFALREILAGRYDAYIDDWAQGVASLDHPVAIRFAHEMNGHWYPWSAGVNGNSARDYVDTWRYVHGRFRAAGADNVIWVWSPNIEFTGSQPIEPLYPGDDYVDWVGIVGYFGHEIGRPTSFPTFDELYGPTLETVRGITGKPIVFTEVSAIERGGLKPAWIDAFFEGLAAQHDVIGFVWFDVREPGVADWRIGSSEATRRAFARNVASPMFEWDPAPYQGAGGVGQPR